MQKETATIKRNRKRKEGNQKIKVERERKDAKERTKIRKSVKRRNLHRSTSPSSPFN